MATIRPPSPDYCVGIQYVLNADTLDVLRRVRGRDTLRLGVDSGPGRVRRAFARVAAERMPARHTVRPLSCSLRSSVNGCWRVSHDVTSTSPTPHPGSGNLWGFISGVLFLVRGRGLGYNDAIDV